MNAFGKPKKRPPSSCEPPSSGVSAAGQPRRLRSMSATEQDDAGRGDGGEGSPSCERPARARAWRWRSSRTRTGPPRRTSSDGRCPTSSNDSARNGRRSRSTRMSARRPRGDRPPQERDTAISPPIATNAPRQFRSAPSSVSTGRSVRGGRSEGCVDDPDLCSAADPASQGSPSERQRGLGEVGAGRRRRRGGLSPT